MRERFNVLKSAYEARLRGVVGQLKETLWRVQGDAAVTALSADATTADFVPVSSPQLHAWGLGEGAR